jgi:hypothetical protein
VRPPALGGARRARFRAPLRADAVARGGARPAPAPAPLGLDRGRAVVVGVIDDAINPLHARFRGPGGETRVDSHWSQDARATAMGTVPFGRAWSRAELEAELARPASTDEARLRRLGLVDPARGGPQPLARRISHGTHVADLAAGFAPGAAPREVRLVTVALPGLVTLDTSGASLAPFLVAALDHVLDQAAARSRAEGFPLPVVVNFSYAVSGGPQDGTHPIETAIDALAAAHEARMRAEFPKAGAKALARARVEVILPSGNSRQDRMHAARAAAASGATRLDLDWRINPGDVTDNLLEIWLPEGAGPPALAVTPPGQTGPLPVAGLAPESPRVLQGPDGAVIGRAAVDVTGPAGKGACRRLLVALAPSAAPAGTRVATAPPGRWRVAVEADLPAGTELRAFVHRDDPPAGYARPGRRSWLEDPSYALYGRNGAPADEDTPATTVRRAGTLSGIATSPGTCTVAGWQGAAPATPPAETRPAPFAGESPPGLPGVDRAARTDRSPVLRGLLAAGTASGSRVALSGTSVAAPQVARARMLHWLGAPAPAPLPVALPADPDREAARRRRLGTEVVPPF